MNTRHRSRQPFVRARVLALALLLTATLGAPQPAQAATGPTCYVDISATPTGDGDSWGTAYTDLQSALTDTNCTEIRVAEGTYKPTSGSDRTIAFEILAGKNVLGGYPPGGGTRDPQSHTTILSGDIGTPDDLSDNSLHVVKMEGVAIAPVTNATILDGFTITRGNANAGGLDDQEGAALLLDGQVFGAVAMELYRQPYCGCIYSEQERYDKKLRRQLQQKKKEKKD